MTNTFRIPEQNYERFLENINILNRRARKLRVAPIQVIEHDVEYVQYEDTYSVKHVQAYQHCEVIGETPRINGWEFIATIELDEDGLGIINAVPGMVQEGELSSFRKATNWCDQCQRRQVRNNVYILRSDDGTTYKQVGSTCLVDFLGHENPMSLAAQAEMLIDAYAMATDACDEDAYGMGGGSRNWLVLEEYLTWVAGCIRNYGWMSKTKVEQNYGEGWATSERSLDSMLGKEKKYYPQECDRELAKASIAWIREHEEYIEEGNDYQAKLYTVCRKDMIHFKHVGVAASLIVAYQKAMEIEYERKNRKESKPQGNVGEKLVLTVTCTKVIAYESQFTRGSSYIIMMIDEDGNRYKWFASKCLMAEDSQYTVKGTVKGHDEYKGVISTILTRCKAEEVFEPLAG